MDAIEFLRDFRRMCNSYGDTCGNCKLDGDECSFSDCVCDHQKMIRVVEEWAKKHPEKTVKTRFSEFKKMFPNYNYPFDLPNGCVREFDCSATCRTNCHICKKAFWLTPIEEEEE